MHAVQKSWQQWRENACLLPVERDERVETCEATVVEVLKQRLHVRNTCDVTRAKERNGICCRKISHVNGGRRSTRPRSASLQQGARVARLCTWQILCRSERSCNKKRQHVAEAGMLAREERDKAEIKGHIWCILCIFGNNLEVYLQSRRGPDKS